MYQALSIVPLARRSVRLTMRLRLMSVLTNLISLCFCLLALWMVRVGRCRVKARRLMLIRFYRLVAVHLFLITSLLVMVTAWTMMRTLREIYR